MTAPVIDKTNKEQNKAIDRRIIPFFKRLAETAHVDDEVSLTTLGCLKNPGSYKHLLDMIPELKCWIDKFPMLSKFTKEDLDKAANAEAYLSLDSFRQANLAGEISSIMHEKRLEKLVRLAAARTLINMYADCWKNAKAFAEKARYWDELNCIKNMRSDLKPEISALVKQIIKKQLGKKPISLAIFILRDIFKRQQKEEKLQQS